MWASPPSSVFPALSPLSFPPSLLSLPSPLFFFYLRVSQIILLWIFHTFSGEPTSVLLHGSQSGLPGSGMCTSGLQTILSCAHGQAQELKCLHQHPMTWPLYVSQSERRVVLSHCGPHVSLPGASSFFCLYCPFDKKHQVVPDWAMCPCLFVMCSQ